LSVRLSVRATLTVRGTLSTPTVVFFTVFHSPLKKPYKFAEQPSPITACYQSLNVVIFADLQVLCLSARKAEVLQDCTYAAPQLLVNCRVQAPVLLDSLAHQGCGIQQCPGSRPGLTALKMISARSAASDSCALNCASDRFSSMFSLSSKLTIWATVWPCPAGIPSCQMHRRNFQRLRSKPTEPNARATAAHGTSGGARITRSSSSGCARKMG